MISIDGLNYNRFVGIKIGKCEGAAMNKKPTKRKASKILYECVEKHSTEGEIVRVSGSLRYCSYVMAELEQCGFKAFVRKAKGE